MSRLTSDHLPKAGEVFDFICQYKLEHNGNSPTIREIGDGCAIPSTSTVNYYLEYLVRQQRISFGDGHYRNIIIPNSHWSMDNDI